MEPTRYLDVGQTLSWWNEMECRVPTTSERPHGSMDVDTMDGRIRAQWSVVIVTDRAPGVGRCNGSPANLQNKNDINNVCIALIVTYLWSELVLI